MRVPEKYYDEKFDFRGEWDMLSTCGLKIVRKASKDIVVVTELYQENPGTSVTYAGSSLLLQICEAKGLDLNRVIYVECNPDTRSKLSFYNEEYFLVQFREKDGKLTDPSYKQMTDQEICDLIYG